MSTRPLLADLLLSLSAAAAQTNERGLDARRTCRDEELTLLLQMDVHAPANSRVDGPFANVASFAATFKCPEGKGLVRRAAGRVVAR